MAVRCVQACFDGDIGSTCILNIMAAELDLDFVDFDEVEPSFLVDGLGVAGEQSGLPELDFPAYETDAYTIPNDTPEDFISTEGCNPGAPPGSGTYVLGTDGSGHCTWIDTTTFA